MNRNKPPSFNGYERGPDFDRARSQIATPFQYVDVLLDRAETNYELNIAGDFLYLDPAGSGSVTLELNNQQFDASAPFSASAGFGINAIFKRLKLSWAAQPGKKIRLMYSTGDRIVPTNSTTINGAVTVTQNGDEYTSSFVSTAALAAATAQAVFLPAANVAGAVLVSASAFHNDAGTAQFALIAHTSAPAAITDGDLISFSTDGSAAAPSRLSIQRSLKIPVGKGLYYFSPSAESAGWRSALYRLL